MATSFSLNNPKIIKSADISTFNSHSEPESDIIDNDHDPRYEYDRAHELPPRPMSRLGFNCDSNPAIQQLDPQFGHTTCHLDPEKRETTTSNGFSSSRSSTFKWTRCLFQRIGIASLPAPGPDPTPEQIPDYDMDFTSSLDPHRPKSASPPTLPSFSSFPSSSNSSLDDIDMDEASMASSDELYISDDSDASSEDSDMDIDPDDSSSDPRRHFISLPSSLASDKVPFPSSPTITLPTPTPTSTSTHSRQKFSCLPSPLSPHQSSTSSFTWQRHSYRNHGYSRHSLMHLKWFWATREEEWQAYDAGRLQDSNVYGGISIFDGTTNIPSTCSGPLNPPGIKNNNSKDTQQKRPCQQLQPLPPLTIHPRRGDISGLRDPYCAHIDRYFVGLPLWTMAKTLWMFDVHMSVERRAWAAAAEIDVRCGEEESGGDDDEEDTSSSLSLSTGFSDDSDATLVESEVEREAEAGRDVNAMNEDVEGEEDVVMLQEDDVGMEKAGCLNHESACAVFESTAVPTASPEHHVQDPTRLPDPSSKLKLKKCQPLSQSAQSIPISERIPGKTPSPPLWETNWYKRWEVLIELVRMDRDREWARWESSSSSTCGKGSGESCRTMSPRFFLPGEEDGEGDGGGGECCEGGCQDDDEDEDEDEEDVIILSNPLFMNRGREQAVHV